MFESCDTFYEKARLLYEAFFISSQAENRTLLRARALSSYIYTSFLAAWFFLMDLIG